MAIVEQVERLRQLENLLFVTPVNWPAAEKYGVPRSTFRRQIEALRQLGSEIKELPRKGQRAAEFVCVRKIFA